MFVCDDEIINAYTRESDSLTWSKFKCTVRKHLCQFIWSDHNILQQTPSVTSLQYTSHFINLSMYSTSLPMFKFAAFSLQIRLYKNQIQPFKLLIN